MKRRFLSWVLVILCFVCGAGLAEQAGGELPSGYRYMLADGWMYYCVQTEADSFTLFRMKEDGTGSERLMVQEADSFAFSHGMLYFYDATDLGGSTRMRASGGQKELLFPSIAHGLQAAGDFIYWVGLDLDGDDRVFRVAHDIPAVVIEGGNNFWVDTTVMEMLPIGEPYEIRVYGGYVYYVAYDGEDCILGRMREDGTGDERVYTPDAERISWDVRILGFEGDTVYFGTFGKQSDGFTAAWSPDAGVEMLDVPQSAAYADGYFYHNRQTNPEMDAAGVFRCRTDGSDALQVTDVDLLRLEVQGDWLFGEIGEGLNAEPVMLPTDGGAKPVTVPGFGVYDYEANAPVEDAEPEIDWSYNTYGEGDVALDLVTYEESACYRLMRVVDGQPGEEVLLVHAGPYERVTLCFEPGEYIVKIARGEKWISDAQAFGPGGDYSVTQAYAFAAGDYEISVGERGDFYEDDASGFME